MNFNRILGNKQLFYCEANEIVANECNTSLGDILTIMKCELTDLGLRLKVKYVTRYYRQCANFFLL